MPTSGISELSIRQVHSGRLFIPKVNIIMILDPTDCLAITLKMERLM